MTHKKEASMNHSIALVCAFAAMMATAGRSVAAEKLNVLFLFAGDHTS